MHMHFLSNRWLAIFLLSWPSFGLSQSIAVVTVANLPNTVSETSGLEGEGTQQFWTHNDSGGNNELYEISSSGTVERTLVVENATNVDWEELAQDDAGNLYIGDFGNNANARMDLQIYKIPNPNGLTSDTVTAEIIEFTYEDQTMFPPPDSLLNFDMEAMIWYRGKLHLFSKNRTDPFDGFTRHYSLPDSAGTFVAEFEEEFFTGNGVKEAYWTTAADISPNGKYFAMISSTRLWVFSCFPEDRFFEGMVQELTINNTRQYEALYFATDSIVYLTHEELGGIIPAALVVTNLDPFYKFFALEVNLGADTTLNTDSLFLDAGVADASYLWNTGDTSQSIFVSNSGNYHVTVTKGGCMGSDTIQVDFTTAISPLILPFTMHWQSIPTGIELHIFSDQTHLLNWEVLTVSGVKVKEGKTHLNGGKEVLPIEFKNAAQGIYLLKLSIPGHASTSFRFPIY